VLVAILKTFQNSDYENFENLALVPNVRSADYGS